MNDKNESDDRVYLVRCTTSFYVDLAVVATDFRGGGGYGDLEGYVDGCAVGVLADDLPDHVRVHDWGMPDLGQAVLLAALPISAAEWEEDAGEAD